VFRIVIYRFPPLPSDVISGNTMNAVITENATEITDPDANGSANEIGKSTLLIHFL
jgi:hypothetical protein